MLSKRLNAVASFVPKGAQAIDIGCDHGYLGIYLVKESLVKSIILTDIKESALNQAKKNILKAKLDIKTILTNGLENVNTNDLDTIIISGMGTKTIIDILNTGCLDRIENLVLSSNNNLYELRDYVESIGFYLQDEVTVLEHGIYNVITYFNRTPRKWSLKVMKYGIPKPDKKEYYEYLINTNKDIYQKIPKKNIRKRLELIKERYDLKRLLKECW